jgi:hypothetical protein
MKVINENEKISIVDIDEMTLKSMVSAFTTANLPEKRTLITLTNKLKTCLKNDVI